MIDSSHGCYIYYGLSPFKNTNCHSCIIGCWLQLFNVKPNHDSDSCVLLQGVSDIRCSYNLKFRVGLHDVSTIEFLVNARLRYCIRHTPGNLSMERTCLIVMYLACQKPEYRVN